MFFHKLNILIITSKICTILVIQNIWSPFIISNASPTIIAHVKSNSNSHKLCILIRSHLNIWSSLDWLNNWILFLFTFFLIRPWMFQNNELISAESSTRLRYGFFFHFGRDFNWKSGRWNVDVAKCKISSTLGAI